MKITIEITDDDFVEKELDPELFDMGKFREIFEDILQEDYFSRAFMDAVQFYRDRVVGVL